MKSLLRLIPILVLFSCARPQSNFEGTIVYKGYTDSEGDSSGYDILYGKSKMRMISWFANEGGQRKYSGEYEIFDFEKSQRLVINNPLKKVSIDTFFTTPDDEENIKLEKTSERARIGNYEAIKYSGLPPKTGSYIRSSELWFSDDLVYFIPEKFLRRHDLPAAETRNILWLQNRTVIDLVALVKDTNLIKGLTKKKTTTFVKADKIIPGPLSDTLFAIPADYRLVYERIKTFRVEVKDVEISEISQEEDKLEPPPPPPPPPKRRKSTAPSH